MSKSESVEMFVGGLVLDPNTQAPIIILKDESGELCLPIWIGIAEATSIASVIKKINLQRPMTHDLMYDAINQLGAKVQQVAITDLKDSTYFAELVISYGDKAMILDARPSDVIALALRASAPIYVARHVLDQAKVVAVPALALQSKDEKSEGKEGANSNNSDSSVKAGEEQSVEEEDQNPTEQDFKTIQKDKWASILEELDPKDFKNKM